MKELNQARDQCGSSGKPELGWTLGNSGKNIIDFFSNKQEQSIAISGDRWACL